MAIDWFVTYTPKANFWGAQPGNYVHFLDLNFLFKKFVQFFWLHNQNITNYGSGSVQVQLPPELTWTELNVNQGFSLEFR